MSKTEPESPCIRHCCLNDDDVCVGCFRHLDEITAWHNSSAQQKQMIILRSQERAKENAL